MHSTSFGADALRNKCLCACINKNNIKLPLMLSERKEFPPEDHVQPERGVERERQQTVQSMQLPCPSPWLPTFDPEAVPQRGAVLE